jgi:hypothetical protein
MKFKRLNEDVPEGIGLVCRQTRGVISKVVIIVVLLVLAPLGLAGVVFGLLALCLLPAVVRDFRLARRPTNWLLRIGPDRLWINARAYDDESAHDEPCVVELEYHEIVDARHDTEVYAVPHYYHNYYEVTRKIESLVFRLHQQPPAELAEMIEANRRHAQPARRTRLGFTRQYGPTRSPVSLPAPDEIRLIWNGGDFSIRPRLQRTLKELGQYVTVGEPTQRDETGASIKERVVQLIRTGETTAACQLLVRHGRMTPAQAQEFVDELAKKA